MADKLDEKTAKAFDKAELTARLAYLEASFLQFEQLKKSNGDAIYVNNEPVFKYRQEIENYDLYVMELPREVKRNMVEEHVRTKPPGIIKSVQEELRKPNQIKHLSEVLKLQRADGDQEKPLSDFVIVGPSVETGFRILMIVIKK